MHSEKFQVFDFYCMFSVLFFYSLFPSFGNHKVVTDTFPIVGRNILLFLFCTRNVIDTQDYYGYLKHVQRLHEMHVFSHGYLCIINNDWNYIFFYLCYISTEERIENTARFLVIATELYTLLTLDRYSIGFLRHQTNLGRVRPGIPVWPAWKDCYVRTAGTQSSPDDWLLSEL